MQKAPRALQFVVSRDYEALSRQAAEIVLTELQRKPGLLLCASAGKTPSGLYRKLAEVSRERPALFKSLRVLQVDEWLGVPPESPASCKSDLNIKLIQPAGIKPARFFSFDGGTADAAGECQRIGRVLEREGPIDICILGLGANGHVAMNEPAQAVLPGVHVARLARSSQEHPLLNAVVPKPTRGLTLGLGDILRSRKVLLLVSGRHKRVPFARLTRARVAIEFPASLLWLHGDATVLCDALAYPQQRPVHRPPR